MIMTKDRIMLVYDIIVTATVDNESVALECAEENIDRYVEIIYSMLQAMRIEFVGSFNKREFYLHNKTVTIAIVAYNQDSGFHHFVDRTNP